MLFSYIEFLIGPLFPLQTGQSLTKFWYDGPTYLPTCLTTPWLMLLHINKDLLSVPGRQLLFVFAHMVFLTGIHDTHLPLSG